MIFNEDKSKIRELQAARKKCSKNKITLVNRKSSTLGKRYDF
jgi:hypothetical protein